MTNMTAIVGVRELTAAEVDCIAGGTPPAGDDGIGGGSEPSAAEVEIGAMATGLNTFNTDGFGINWASDGGIIWFADTDRDGYWDYAEFQSGPSTYVYNVDTNAWEQGKSYTSTR